MATIIDTPPDKIQEAAPGEYLFYFMGGKELNALLLGAEFTTVYSPQGHNGTWHATRFKVVPGERNVPAYAVVKRRDLTAEEIAHFEGLIADS